MENVIKHLMLLNGWSGKGKIEYVVLDDYIVAFDKKGYCYEFDKQELRDIKIKELGI